MFSGIWTEEAKPLYIDLEGAPVERSPFTHPYNYDTFVVWKSSDFRSDRYSVAYSDRLRSWDIDRYDKCYLEVFSDSGQRFDNKDPKSINKFLEMYFGISVKLTALLQACNQQSGFPYWAFLYEDVSI